MPIFGFQKLFLRTPENMRAADWLFPQQSFQSLKMLCFAVHPYENGRSVAAFIGSRDHKVHVLIQPSFPLFGK
jgi:hypothetical protein